MYIKTITYTDYNGESRTEDFYFNITKAELAEYNIMTEGGLEAKIKRITAAKEATEIFKMFKALILMSYGKKSDDGKRFIKSPELTDAFTQTEAYTELFMQLATDEEEANRFVKNVMPKVSEA